MFPLLSLIDGDSWLLLFIKLMMAMVTYFSSKLYPSNLQRVNKLGAFRTLSDLLYQFLFQRIVKVHVSAICKGFPRRVATKFFLLLIYYVILWTRLYGFITHLIFLHISINFNSLAPARNKGNCPLLVPLLHFFAFFQQFCHHSQTLSYGWCLWGF